MKVDEYAKHIGVSVYAVRRKIYKDELDVEKIIDKQSGRERWDIKGDKLEDGTGDKGERKFEGMTLETLQARVLSGEDPAIVGRIVTSILKITQMESGKTAIKKKELENLMAEAVLREKMGELVKASDVETTMRDAFSQVKRAVLSVPMRIVRGVHKKGIELDPDEIEALKDFLTKETNEVVRTLQHTFTRKNPK